MRTVLVMLLTSISLGNLRADQVVIPGPTGSGIFGERVAVLPNGNFVVLDPEFDGAAADVGAVYLYRSDEDLGWKI